VTEERSFGSASKRSLSGAVLGVTGILLYAMVGWPYLGSGLVVPFPWVFALWAIWVGGLFVLIRVVKRYPVWTPAVPVAALIAWVAFVQLGVWLFGWSA